MTTCDNIDNLSASQVTHTKLIGAGIVCGLEVFKDSQCFISISAGVGVTSKGSVICIGDKTLKYYRKYKDTKIVDCNDNTQLQYELWELLEHREEGKVYSIVPQNTADIEKPFLEGKVVLLYLEDEEKMTVRILLIDELDMWKILKCTCILETHCILTEPKEEEDISIFDKEEETGIPGEEELYNAVHKKYMLNYIPIRRFGYGSTEIDDLNVGDSKEENLEPKFDFNSANEFFTGYEKIIDEALENLDDEIDKLHDNFGCMIDACCCKEGDTGAEEKSPCNPVTSESYADTGLQAHNIKIFKNYLSFINKKWAAYKKYRKPVESIQYFYDFVKDLITTYNELLDELYELMNECCADTSCFPRHLMLGRIKEEVSFQPSIFRQPFLQPPIYNDNASRLQRIRFLHWRMVIMMKCFYIPDWELDDMSDEDYYDVLQMENEKKALDDPKDYLPVRITPGRLFNEPLGKRAIPFYYNLSNSTYSLQFYWDYTSTKHNREDHQLSYFCKEIPGYSNLNFVMHPFVYSLDNYPFYRIEGHTGMKVTDAITAIKNLRKRYALSFQILPVTFENLQDLFSSDDNEMAAYGLEHAGGVQKGYTFILLHDGSEAEPGIIIADFQVPFMIVKPANSNLPMPPPVPPQPLPPSPVPPEPVDEKDDLKKIKGISDKTEALLNKAGITTYKQLAKLTAADISELSNKTGIKSFNIKESWFTQAKELSDNK